MEALLKAGADPEQATPGPGWRTLHFAAVLDSAEPTEALLKAGAELEAQTAWLRSLDSLAVPPEEARAAAAPAERLTDLLADGRLDAKDCRSFLELSRRHRGQSR